MEIISIEEIINKESFKPLESCAICGLCQGIIIEPVQCQGCDSCYCKVCIEKYEKTHKGCPAGCTSGQEMKESRMMKNILSVLKFKCHNGCDQEIMYPELKDHYENKCSKINYMSKYNQLTEKINQLKHEISILKTQKKRPLIAGQFISSHHKHPLILCITDRMGYNCDVCRASHMGKEWGYYCTACDYDLCVSCEEQEERSNL